MPKTNMYEENLRLDWLAKPGIYRCVGQPEVGFRSAHLSYKIALHKIRLDFTSEIICDSLNVLLLS